ncbi:MAG: SsrA-binding protein SmpB [Bacteroidales bacterium]|jgi:SsrA-binding protein
MEIKNRKAEYQYFLMAEYTAGIVLTGTEIKSIREGKANLSDAYCSFNDKGELFVINMHISVYSLGTYSNHEPKRPRKLLLNKKELKKIKNQTVEKGLTIIPTLLFIDENGLAKLTINVARGKKSYDKRESLKAKTDKREIERHMSNYY